MEDGASKHTSTTKTASGSRERLKALAQKHEQKFGDFSRCEVRIVTILNLVVLYLVLCESKFAQGLVPRYFEISFPFSIILLSVNLKALALLALISHEAKVGYFI